MPKSSVHNLNILSHTPLPSPREIKAQYPLSESLTNTVNGYRQTLQRILSGEDQRLFVLVGPCSLHDLEAGREYASKLQKVAEELSEKLFIVMRVYFEKPRTTVGWKGFINDPALDDSFQLEKGLRCAREFLHHLVELGLPAGTEALDPITPQYIGDLITWTAIGARTTESQTHRELASGLSSPVGFKNGTDGSIDVALNALRSAAEPHHFLGLNQDGLVSTFRTKGNRFGHIVLRGGPIPNYDAVSVAEATAALQAAELNDSIVVDCSHGNSRKDYRRQPSVFRDCLRQLSTGESNIRGLSLESNLHEGNQSFPNETGQLQYGVSITDSCIGWEETEILLREAAENGTH